MKRLLLKIQFVALFFLSVSNIAFAQWSNVNPIGAFPRYRGATFVIGDTAYLGNGDNPFYVSDFRKYTQAGNTWIDIQACPNGGGDQGFRFTINDTGFVGDGANPGYHNNFYAYTPSLGWSAALPVPPGGSRIFSAGFSIGDTGYFGTGFSPSNFTFSDFYGYDRATNSWSTLASLPVGRAGGVAFSANGKGYMGLGYENNTAPGPNYQDMYQYDPVNNVWNTMASMPGLFGEGEPAYFVLCGKLIVVSGQRVHEGTGVDSATNQTWMFDPSDGPKGKWTRLQDFPGVPAYSPEGFAMGDTGFVVGGYTTPTGALSQMWRYVPALVLTPALAADTVVCAGTQVTLNAAGGATYKWSTGDSTGSSNDTTSSITVSPVNTTTYYYTATGNPCFNLDSIIIKVKPAPALIILPPSSTICNGKNDTLHVSSGGTNFIWTPSTGLNATTGDTVIASPTITTVYSVAGNDSLGCRATGTDTVSVGTSAPLIILPQSASLCSGQSDTLIISGGGSNFMWSPSLGLNSTSGDTVVANPDITVTYTVNGLNSTGCASTGTDIINVNSAQPLIILPQPPPTFCSGLSAELKVSGGGTNFIWYPTTGLSDTTSGDSVLAAPLATTTYTVTGIDSLGCASSGSEVVTVIASPNKPTFYQHGDTLISSSQFDNQWYRNDTLLLNDTSRDLIITIAGKYWVVVNNEANGCSTSSDTVITTGINQLSLIANQLSIYPNPFANGFFIKINSSVQNVKEWSIQITDVLGRMVYNKPSLNYSNDIDLSNLTGGIYFIAVINKTGRDAVPVVKQN